jgi:hypothetical protein
MAVVSPHHDTLGSDPSAARLRMSCVMRMERNLGPHVEQKFADWSTSCGSVSMPLKNRFLTILLKLPIFPLTPK